MKVVINYYPELPVSSEALM